MIKMYELIHTENRKVLKSISIHSFVFFSISLYYVDFHFDYFQASMYTCPYKSLTVWVVSKYEQLRGATINNTLSYLFKGIYDLLTTLTLWPQTLLKLSRFLFLVFKERQTWLLWIFFYMFKLYIYIYTDFVKTYFKIYIQYRSASTAVLRSL